MKRAVYILFLLFFAARLQADCGCACDCGFELGQPDHPEVYEFVQEKRATSLLEKLKEGLKLSGDIRAEATTRQETRNGVKLRGHNRLDKKGYPIPLTNYDVQFNFYVNYKADRTWGQCYIYTNNAAGIEECECPCTILDNPEDTPKNRRMFGSGFCDDICIKRLFWGWNLWKSACDAKLDVEIGRRPMYTVFDSRIQFKNRFDGVIFAFNDVLKHYSDKRSTDYFFTVGTFLIDLRTDHFGWAAETGMYNIYDWGIDLKLSVIDWSRITRNRFTIVDPRGSKFFNLQVTPAYNFPEELFKRPVRIYAGLEANVEAKDLNELLESAGFFDVTPNIGKQNMAGYLGLIIGDVKKRGDWSLDMNLQFVGAQAVPESDLRGLGLGNVDKESVYCDLRGNPNYKGYHIEFLYALTDKLSVDISYDHTWNLKKIEAKKEILGVIRTFGGTKTYHKWEIDLIHKF